MSNIKLFQSQQIRSVWNEEGSELLTICKQLKMEAEDGKHGFIAS